MSCGWLYVTKGRNLNIILDPFLHSCLIFYQSITCIDLSKIQLVFSISILIPLVLDYSQTWWQTVDRTPWFRDSPHPSLWLQPEWMFSEYNPIKPSYDFLLTLDDMDLLIWSIWDLRIHISNFHLRFNALGIWINYNSSMKVCYAFKGLYKLFLLMDSFFLRLFSYDL